MQWIYESPLTILLVGASVTVLAAMVLLQVSQRAALLGILICLALTAVLLVVERVVVTDQERVETTLHGIAAALEQDDQSAALGYISSSAPQLRTEVTNYMRIAKVSRAKVGSGLKVTFFHATMPPTAKASLIGSLELQSAHTAGELKYAGRIRVSLVKEGDDWLISGYERQ